MKRGWLYIRVSTKGQEESGLSLNDQQQEGERYADYHKLDIVDRVCVDAESAYTRRFRNRPAARLIWENIQSGDQLIIVKLDRAFRNTGDCLDTVDELIGRGVGVHLLDMQVDTTTAVGRLMLSVVAAFAEFESRRRGERITEARRAGWQIGRPMRKHPPCGFRWVGKGLARRLAPCSKSRAIMRQIWDWKQVDKLSLTETYFRCIKLRIVRPRDGNEWTRGGICAALDVEAQLRQIEAENPELTESEVAWTWLGIRALSAPTKKARTHA